MSDRGHDRPQILAERLRVGAGFGAEDRAHVLEILAALNRHLARWRPEQVDLQISVKDRGGTEQKVTIEAWLPGWVPLVATSIAPEVGHALVEVRKDLIRQIEDEKTKRDLHKPR